MLKVTVGYSEQLGYPAVTLSNLNETHGFVWITETDSTETNEISAYLGISKLNSKGDIAELTGRQSYYVLRAFLVDVECRSLDHILNGRSFALLDNLDMKFLFHDGVSWHLDNVDSFLSAFCFFGNPKLVTLNFTLADFNSDISSSSLSDRSTIGQR